MEVLMSAQRQSPVAIGAILSIIMICCAQASEIPSIDTQSVCEGKSKLAKLPTEGLKPAFMSLCQWSERTSLAKIRTKWNHLPVAITDRCLVSAAMFGYEILNTCLDDAAQSLERSEGGPSYTLFEGGQRSRRYWTHAECMEARNDGTGVCVN
jgi:hypothetical protein